MGRDVPPVTGLTDAHCLLVLGDSVTTDHISPAGSIARNSPAARLLGSKGLTPREFNSYGSRRGNDAIMARGYYYYGTLVVVTVATQLLIWSILLMAQICCLNSQISSVENSIH